MVVSIVAFVILGAVLEGIPAIVLFGPLLFPIARSSASTRCTTRWWSILAMGIGLFAPPFGVGYYAACAIGRVDPDEGMRPIWPYLLALLIGLLVVAAIPVDFHRLPVIDVAEFRLPHGRLNQQRNSTLRIVNLPEAALMAKCTCIC